MIFPAVVFAISLCITVSTVPLDKVGSSFLSVAVFCTAVSGDFFYGIFLQGQSWK